MVVAAEVVQAAMEGGEWTVSIKHGDLAKMQGAFPTKTFTLVVQVSECVAS